jgi:hypothetical protein
MNPDKARMMIMIPAEALTWLAVHGNLCLALRHPDNNSPRVRPRMIKMVKRLGELLVESGLLTQAEIDEATRYELEQGNDITQ